MKYLIHILIVLILILLSSYLTLSFELKTYVINSNQENTEASYNNLNTFVIEQKPSGRFMLIETHKQTKNARQRNLEYEYRDEEIEKCINKITKNWKRTYYKTSYNKFYSDEEEKWVHDEGSPFYEKEKGFYGYDPEEDWQLYWRLRNRALNGEKIC